MATFEQLTKMVEVQIKMSNASSVANERGINVEYALCDI